MTRLILSISFVCFLLGNHSASAQNAWHAEFNRLLKTYVKPGGIDYPSWQKNAADRAALSSVVDQMARAKISGFSREGQLAFYLNGYNANILDAALEKYGKEKSIKDGKLFFFKRTDFLLAGQTYSFEGLENDVIRKKFSEPRIHFAINCASHSCPPLRNEVYTEAALGQQLAEQTKAFANSTESVRIDAGSKTLFFNEIFDWFSEDFGGDPVTYLNQYRSTPLPAGYKVKFYDYDWSFNVAK